ncbi:MAG: branched-chain amino acid ABC transporter permease [Hyphomicrobiaceae bacterium]
MDARGTTPVRFLPATAGLIALLVAPPFLSEFHASVSVITGIYVILMVGLSLFLGYGGQFSFAQAVFYGIGAYTSGILTTRYNVPPLAGLACSALLGGLSAYALSAPILRLQGYYLAVATLAFCQIFHVLIVENFAITGGPTGIYGIPPFSLFGFEFSSGRSYHYLVWAIAVISLLFARNLMNSRIGRALKALQSGDDAVSVLGIDVLGLRTRIFVLTGVTGAMAGSLFAHFVSYISPGTFTLDLSIWLVVVLAIGGVRSITGTVLGAAFTTVFPFLLGKYQNYNMLVFGVLLILVLKYLPNGLAGLIETQSRRLMGRFADRHA